MIRFDKISNQYYPLYLLHEKEQFYLTLRQREEETHPIPGYQNSYGQQEQHRKWMRITIIESWYIQMHEWDLLVLSLC